MTILLLNTHSTRIDRVAALSKVLSQQGHKTVIPANILSSLFTLWQLQPTVVHFHGWRLASLSWLLALISPQSTLIWTIDSIPPLPKWVLRVLSATTKLICDGITTPTRTLQYWLLNTYKLPVAYIPDGYTIPSAPVIPASHFGLSPDQYSLAIAGDATSLKLILDAYKATKSSKKLVIVHDVTPAATRLQAKYPFLTIIPNQYTRGQLSLVQQASVVIFGDNTPRAELLLQAMASGRAIITTTTPLHQELLGVTGQYYKPGDELALSQAMKKALRSRIQRQAWGLAAKLRASHHFTWERLATEYGHQYHSFRLPVRLDSIHQPV